MGKYSKDLKDLGKVGDYDHLDKENYDDVMSEMSAAKKAFKDGTLSREKYYKFLNDAKIPNSAAPENMRAWLEEIKNKKDIKSIQDLRDRKKEIDEKNME